MNILYFDENLKKDLEIIKSDFNIINYNSYNGENINLVLITVNTIIDFEEKKSEIKGNPIRMGFVEEFSDKLAFENFKLDGWLSNVLKIEKIFQIVEGI